MAANQSSLGCIRCRDTVVAYHPACHIYPRLDVACLGIWADCWVAAEERRRQTCVRGLSRDLRKQTCVAHGMNVVYHIATPRGSNRDPEATLQCCLVDHRDGFDRGYAVGGKERTRRTLIACAAKCGLVVRSLDLSQVVQSNENIGEPGAVTLWLDLQATTISTWSPQQGHSVLLS